MNITRFFLRINIFICLYSDILNQNLNISKIEIYDPPTFLAHIKVNISDLFGQIFTNLPRMCGNKCYGNKIKLKWPIYLKQKIGLTDRKFIKLREETKKHHPVSRHYDRIPFKDINYIFSLSAAFYGMH